MLVPVSHREMDRLETWNCSASVSWVSPFSFLRVLKKAPIFF